MEEDGISPSSTPSRDESLINEMLDTRSQSSSSSSSPKSPLNLPTVDKPSIYENDTENRAKTKQDSDKLNLNGKNWGTSEASNSNIKHKKSGENEDSNSKERNKQLPTEKQTSQNDGNLDNFGIVIRNIKNDLNEPFK